MISLISNYGELLKRLFPIEKNSHGYYEVILFINGWKRVIIDDYFPILYKENNLYYFTASSKKFTNCFYFILLEKSAKINKTYFNIYGGWSYNSLLTLTGFKGENKSIKCLNEREIETLIEKKKLELGKKDIYVELI